jgi:stage V sporulation protein D (sporulation-specific penicillin-binding protein)
MADMPDKSGDNYYGSRVAVPTAQDIMEEVLQYMHFSPEYTEDELRDLDIKVPLLEGSIDEAEATLKALGLKYEKIGNGIDVISQYPLTGTPMSKNGCVYLYTESGLNSEYRQVPDVRYNDLSNANAILQTSELNYSATGASPSAAGAYVAGQNIAPGTMVPKGTVIELEFKLPEVLFAD